MKLKKNTSPLVLLMITADSGKGDTIAKILRSQRVKEFVSFVGEGTTGSGVADIFGFGVDNRDIVWGLIDEKKVPRIFYLLKTKLDFDKPDKGIAMTLPLNGISSDSLELFGLI